MAVTDGPQAMPSVPRMLRHQAVLSTSTSSADHATSTRGPFKPVMSRAAQPQVFPQRGAVVPCTGADTLALDARIHTTTAT